MAGLYASLFAAVSVYHLVGEVVGLAGAAAVALVAVLLAIRIRQEPLAIFGIAASMLAPALVEHNVTGAGMVFAAVIAAGGIPLILRYRWLNVVTVAWLLGIAMLPPLLVDAQSGATAGRAGRVLFVAVFVSELFILDLRGDRRRIGWLGWSLAATSFAVSLGTAFRYWATEACSAATCCRASWCWAWRGSMRCSRRFRRSSAVVIQGPDRPAGRLQPGGGRDGHRPAAGRPWPGLRLGGGVGRHDRVPSGCPGAAAGGCGRPSAASSTCAGDRADSDHRAPTSCIAPLSVAGPPAVWSRWARSTLAGIVFCLRAAHFGRPELR